MLKIAKSVLDLVRNPLFKPEIISYSEYLGNVKILWNKSNLLNDDKAIEKIHHKCIELISHALRWYEKELQTISIEFPNNPIFVCDKYKTQFLRLISDYIHLHCNRRTELKKDNPPKLENITQEMFEQIVELGCN